MERVVAFCGLVCTDCKAFIATQENDDAKQREVAESSPKTLGREIKPEETNCDGCLSRDGCHIGYCDVCEIRKCEIEKSVENCAYCVDYNCEKLARFFEQALEAKKTLLW
jgi:hypothetical protein